MVAGVLAIGVLGFSGYNYIELIDSLDSFLGYRVLDENKALIVYQKGGYGYSAMLNFINMSIEGESEIPKLSAKNRP